MDPAVVKKRTRWGKTSECPSGKLPALQGYLMGPWDTAGKRRKDPTGWRVSKQDSGTFFSARGDGPAMPSSQTVPVSLPGAIRTITEVSQHPTPELEEIRNVLSSPRIFPLRKQNFPHSVEEKTEAWRAEGTFQGHTAGERESWKDKPVPQVSPRGGPILHWSVSLPACLVPC